MSLRFATIQLAQSNVSLRPHLLTILAMEREAGTYQDYVDRKKKEGKPPMKKDEWEARTQGGGKDEDSKGSALKGLSTKMQGFLAGIKGISKAMSESLVSAPTKVQQFVMDGPSRAETLKGAAATFQKSPKKIADAVWVGAKKEVHELKHAGKALAKVFAKPRQEWDAADKKAVYGAAVYVSGAVVAATTGGMGVVAGSLGKSLAMHIAAKSMHHLIDTGFTHFEVGETFLHLVHHLHLAADGDEADQRLLMDHLTVAVGAVLDKGISDEEMTDILKGTKEPNMDDFGQPKEKPNASKKEGGLREQLVRLAHENQALRPHLLPLLAKNAGNGTHVSVRDLPPTVQRALKSLDYNRRDIEVRAQSSVSIQDSGGDGFQGFALVMNISTGDSKLYQGSWGGPNPWAKANPVDMDDRQHTIPMNGAVLKGWRGGGRPVYAVLYVNPDNMATLLPASVELTQEEDWALAIIKGLKPGYRSESFERHGLGAYVANNPVLRSLVQKGLVKATGAGIQITTEGKNAVNPRLHP